MTPGLNKKRIDYLLYHLDKNHFELNDFLKKAVTFNKNEQDKKYIYFPLSVEKEPRPVAVDEILILFPLNSSKFLYHFDDKNNLIFEQDLLTSAFYLLSGYQELLDYKPDGMGRFPFSVSIQSKLRIAVNPLVNVYFKIITDAIEEFCKRNKIGFKRRLLWDKKEFAFLLTHDVDRVEKWTIYTLYNEVRKALRLGISMNYKQLLQSINNLLIKDNPYWTFDWMKKIEQEFKLNSVWFFLPKGKMHIDAYYDLNETRIKNLVKYFQKEGDIIGLHGTFDSWQNEQIMESNLNAVNKIAGQNVIISRQHWLHFKYPETLRILEKIGIKYDSSWGFAEHYGWRNSYCLPFRPYDLENERIMDIWELPLNAMDVTFFKYLKMDYKETYDNIMKMIKICKKYTGLFILLWHNNQFDEAEQQGLKSFYKKILKKTMDYKPFIFTKKTHDLHKY